MPELSAKDDTRYFEVSAERRVPHSVALLIAGPTPRRTISTTCAKLLAAIQIEMLLTPHERSQNPLPPPEIAPGVPAPDTTKDPMLKDPEQGAALLEVRKGLAFQVRARCLTLAAAPAELTTASPWGATGLDVQKA